MNTMKIKVYKVWPKSNPDLWYLVDAPCKHIAKWCGAAIVNNEYNTFLAAKDVAVERFVCKED